MEAVRSQKVINQIMNVDLALKAKDDISKYMEFSFSQFCRFLARSVPIFAANKRGASMERVTETKLNDYQVAVEEGATMVRVGTGIFGERDYSIKED